MLELQYLVVNPDDVLCGVFYLAEGVLDKVNPDLGAFCVMNEIVKLRVFKNQVLHVDALHRGALGKIFLVFLCNVVGVVTLLKKF